MNWRKANRNKKRVQMRTQRRFTAQVGWREWLKKIGPKLIFQPLKGLPYFVEPAHHTSGAYQGPSRYFMIVDDIDFSEPVHPQPTKEFIYGDAWNAYRRINENQGV